MIQFFIGIILYTVGVCLALSNSANIATPEQAKNMIYGGVAAIVIGVILSIWGFISGTTPKHVG